ncbi:hypothetical protein SAMN05216436_12436 [bacterium A37T11]|nr:hypothetical protein SAMN05216436_12436 [bacterium A37T11]
METMKVHTTNYFNTLIEVADDCPLNKAEIPPMKQTGKTVANLHFELLNDSPYKFTSDDVIFSTYAARQDIPEFEWKQERQRFFSKGQACLRSSPLTKRYGWGIHCNEDARVAIYPMESEEYQRLLSDMLLKKVKAMRSKRV